MLYFNFSPNSHLSVVSITFVPHLFMPQLWVCYRLLTRADDFQGLIGFSSLSSAGGPVITTEWKTHVGSAAGGAGWGSSDITMFIQRPPLLGSSLEIQSRLRQVSNGCVCALIWTVWVAMALQCCVTELKMKQRLKTKRNRVIIL